MADFLLCLFLREEINSYSYGSIIYRNLALLASSLQGRTQYEFPLFRSRNHLTLFSIAMGLLELARYVEIHYPLSSAYPWDSWSWPGT
jgi:hypothetical protein